MAVRYGPIQATAAPRVGPSPAEQWANHLHNVAVQAAAGPSYRAATKNEPEFSLTAEQVEADAAVEEVGWVGYVPDYLSSQGSKARFYPAVNVDGTAWTEHESLAQEWNKFYRPHPDMTDGEDLLDRQTWTKTNLANLYTIGEFAAWRLPITQELGGGDGWMTAHPSCLDSASNRNGPKMFAYRNRPDAAKPERSNEVTGYYEYDFELLHRCWKPHHKYTALADFSLRRILPEIRLYRSVLANLTSASKSRLLMNGIVWFPTLEQDVRDDEGSSLADGSTLEGMVQKWGRIGKRAFEDHSSNDPASVIPFPFSHHTAPQYIELGRGADKATLMILPEIIQHAARGMNLPTDFILKGVGESNHWNAEAKNQSVIKSGIEPLLDDYLGWWSKQFIRHLNAVGQKQYTSENLRIQADLTPIAVKENNAPLILEIDNRIPLKPKTLLSSVGLTEEDMDDTGRPQPGEMTQPPLPFPEPTDASTGAVSTPSGPTPVDTVLADAALAKIG